MLKLITYIKGRAHKSTYISLFYWIYIIKRYFFESSLIIVFFKLCLVVQVHNINDNERLSMY